MSATPAHRAFIRYPFASGGDFVNYNLGHDAVLITQEPMATLCFYRDELVGFLPHDDEQETHWVGRSSALVNHKQPLAESKVSSDIRQLYARLGIMTDKQVNDETFWLLYMNEMTHPRVLLDLAARQAFDSLKDL